VRPGTSILLATLAVALAGCGRAREEPASLTVYAPCVVSGPIQKLAAAYEAAHPDVKVSTQVEKPLAMPSHMAEGAEGPAVVFTMGEVEMQTLVQAGAVEAADVRNIAVNTFPLVIVAPVQGSQSLHELSDLTKVERVYLEDPSESTLGARAKEAFENLGLWEEIAAHVVRPNPKAMVLGELLAGGADAAVVFKDCLFAETGTGAPPRTIRIIAELPQNSYPPIHYQAAPLKSAAQPELARAFVQFLASPEGAQATKNAGLLPVEGPQSTWLAPGRED